MKWPICMVLLLSFIGIAGCQSGGKNSEKEEVQSAEMKIFIQNCSNCHGLDLHGGYGPSLQKVGAKYKESEILDIIKNGKGSMPSQNYLSKEEQKKLAKWLSAMK